MGDCFWDTGYLASPDFMMFFSHVVTAGEVPISLYGAYCIVFQTPRKMREVKWLMFNLQLWSTLSDLIICFFGVPVFFMPSFAAFGFGAIDNAPLITYFGFTFFARKFFKFPSRQNIESFKQNSKGKHFLIRQNLSQKSRKPSNLSAASDNKIQQNCSPSDINHGGVRK